MGSLWEWDVDWTGLGSCKMAGLTSEVTELSVYAVTALVAPFSSRNHTFTRCAVNITMRQVWTLVHAHWAAACVTAAQQSSVLLTLRSASGCRYATILASPHLRLSHRLQAWLAFRKVYCFTTLYQLPRLTPNRFKSGRGCGRCDIIFLNSHRITGNNSYLLICQRRTFLIPVSVVSYQQQQQ